MSQESFSADSRRVNLASASMFTSWDFGLRLLSFSLKLGHVVPNPTNVARVSRHLVDAFWMSRVVGALPCAQQLIEYSL
jgi:hypothetical protein